MIFDALARMRCLLDAALPARCFLCGKEGGGAAVCSVCSTSLPPWQALAACPVCALPDTGGEVCGRCSRRPPAFDRTTAAYLYAFPVEQMVQALKYGDALELAAWLGERLVPPDGEWDLLLPVPLHADRLAERGFNQAIELARPLARRGLVLRHDVLRRVRATKAQAGLDARSRRRNLRNAFVASGNLRGRRILLLDDVMTTGATLDAAAAALRRAGAARVANQVLARTPSHR